MKLKYAQICTNMQKYANKNMQTYAKICNEKFKYVNICRNIKIYICSNMHSYARH